MRELARQPRAQGPSHANPPVGSSFGEAGGAGEPVGLVGMGDGKVRSDM